MEEFVWGLEVRSASWTCERPSTPVCLLFLVTFTHPTSSSSHSSKDSIHPQKIAIYSTHTQEHSRSLPFVKRLSPIEVIYSLSDSLYSAPPAAFSCFYSWFGIPSCLFIIWLGVRSFCSQCLAFNLHCSPVLCFGILFFSLSSPSRFWMLDVPLPVALPARFIYHSEIYPHIIASSIVSLCFDLTVPGI